MKGLWEQVLTVKA